MIIIINPTVNVCYGDEETMDEKSPTTLNPNPDGDVTRCSRAAGGLI
jgi:hypothetical protein